MAIQGRPVDNHTQASVIRWRSQGISITEIARRELVSIPTVRKILQTGVDKVPVVRVR